MTTTDSPPTASRRLPLTGALGVGFLVSVAAYSLYIFFTRWPASHFSALSDFSALGIAVLFGITIIARSHASLSRRAASCIAFAAFTGPFLFFYAFMFVALVFHDGL